MIYNNNYSLSLPYYPIHLYPSPVFPKPQKNCPLMDKNLTVRKRKGPYCARAWSCWRFRYSTLMAAKSHTLWQISSSCGTCGPSWNDPTFWASYAGLKGQMRRSKMKKRKRWRFTDVIGPKNPKKMWWVVYAETSWRSTVSLAGENTHEYSWILINTHEEYFKAWYNHSIQEWMIAWMDT